MKTIRFRNINQLREEILSDSCLDQYILVHLDDREVTWYPGAIERLLQLASDSDASISYANFRERMPDGTLRDHPVPDMQIGSVRDNFDFGAVVLLNSGDTLAASEDLEKESELLDGGWYALRLRLMVGTLILQVPEFMYETRPSDLRDSGEKQHDYVDPSRKEYQKQMEQCFTEHLFEINCLVESPGMTVEVEEGEFPIEASVVIPVRNRARTIRDAVESALGQMATFQYNVIVVDNGSTDGTSEILDSIKDDRLVVIRPSEDEHLGIGGCWNKALYSEKCGRFAVQLDSDDLYSEADTLQRIVDKFYEDGCAMVIGSYRMTDFDLNTIPPGVIDHKEWTDENGPNNLLRVNGAGAPRAFFTPLLRELGGMPNVSYGEDYAVALRISRDYRIGRIFDPLYICRRWEGNSDASLSPEQVNKNDYYKDFLRSVEIVARKADNDDPEEEEDINDYL